MYKDNTNSEPMKGEFTIKWLSRTDSTNNEVLRHAGDLDNLSVIAAREQTAGRGQRGNRWKSAAGENLTFSAFVRFGESPLPVLPASRQFAISQAATLAVANLLRSKGIDARIKWPNDIYCGDKKICGMLIENRLKGGDVDFSVIGIGLNVRQRQFDPDLMNPTSMSLITGEDYALEPLLEEICKALSVNLLKLGTLTPQYLDLLYRKGELRSYTDVESGEVFRGTIKGISEEGMLLVEMPEGCVREFGFKEISYIL